MAIDILILTLIRVISAVFLVEPDLVAAIIDVESGFNPGALGDKDENGVPQSYGLMQLHLQGAGHGYPPDLLLNPAFNILLGCKYIKYLKSIFPNNTKLVISAYNQGPGGAAKRGFDYNNAYVENVLNLRRKHRKEFKT